LPDQSGDAERSVGIGQAAYRRIDRSVPSAKLGGPGRVLLPHRSALLTFEEGFDRAAVLFEKPPRLVVADQIDPVAGVAAAVDRPTAPVASGATLASQKPLAARAAVKPGALEVKICQREVSQQAITQANVAVDVLNFRLPIALVMSSSKRSVPKSLLCDFWGVGLFWVA
jgi:hypothetical protein